MQVLKEFQMLLILLLLLLDVGSVPVFLVFSAVIIVNAAANPAGTL